MQDSIKFTDELYVYSKDIWDSYFSHPFVNQMGDGTLDIEKFKYYMIQDYFYLLQFAKVFALGVVKAYDEETMRYFSSFIQGTLNDEMQIHKTYMKRLGIGQNDLKNTKVHSDNEAYTSYMLWVSSNGTQVEVAVAILSCAWSYLKIAKYLKETYKNSENDKNYGEWISAYTSVEYEKVCIEIINLVNKLAQNADTNQKEKLKEIFRNCSIYEYKFWEMSYECKK